MAQQYTQKLNEQPIIEDISEDYFDADGAHHRFDYLICWDGEQVANQWGHAVWRYKSVHVETELSYASIVTAIVRAEYTADEVEAILLNAAETNSERSTEYQAEMATLQAWRSEAKRIATQVMQTLNQ